MFQYLLAYLTSAAIYKLDLSKNKWINITKGTIEVFKNEKRKGYIIKCENQSFEWKSRKYKMKQNAIITKVIDNDNNNESNITAFRFRELRLMEEFKSRLQNIHCTQK